MIWLYFQIPAQSHFFNGGPDGEDPLSPLVLDPKGNLYSVAIGGGSEELPVVYKYSAGVESVLFRFNDSAGDPISVTVDPKGNLYGKLNLVERTGMALFLNSPPADKKRRSTTFQRDTIRPLALHSVPRERSTGPHLPAE